MLVYIIDGFNLAHKIPQVKRSAGIHLELIRYIKSKKLTGSRNNKVIVVFDGRPEPQAAKEASFKVVFSGRVSADEVIKDKVRNAKNKGQIIVVSDDREIRDFAKDHRVKTCHVMDFVKTAKGAKKESKDISYSLQNEITEEMRKIWGL